MNRYFVISQKSENNEHLNVQDLLPASCKLITGIAVLATAKQVSELQETNKPLCFPQALITDLLQSEKITDLFYSYLRTRADETESRAFFESDILPDIADTINKGLVYQCLDINGQLTFSDSIIDVLETQLTDYLYNEKQLFTEGQDITSKGFGELIADETLKFLYAKRNEIFTQTIQAYKQPESYECGNISLLINGNNFLLRDYVLSANRKVRSMVKEIIPFNEPLGVNSNLHTIFKNNKNSGENTLTIRIYVQYEY